MQGKSRFFQQAELEDDENSDSECETIKENLGLPEKKNSLNGNTGNKHDTNLRNNQDQMIANLQYELAIKTQRINPSQSVGSKKKQKKQNELEEIENSINTLEHDTEVEPDLPTQINLSIKYH